LAANLKSDLLASAAPVAHVALASPATPPVPVVTSGAAFSSLTSAADHSGHSSVDGALGSPAVPTGPPSSQYRQWPARMRRRDASAYLFEQHGVSLTVGSLAKLATIGGGPRFRLDGRFPVYDRDELDAFAESRLGPLRTSTSDTDHQQARK
jgi:hypothetical protein